MDTSTLSSRESILAPTRTKTHPGSNLGAFIKRAFDLLVSVLGLFLLWPFFLFVAVLLKRESPGPVYYRGGRSGKGGKEFKILKFRTMYERPESYQGTSITANGDRRITPLGHWLRDAKLNELPQLWNVLKGEMSLVGPRPEDPEIVKTWPEAARNEILSIRPGITSPASVLYRDEEKMLTTGTVMDEYLLKIMPDKLRLDLLYVRTHNFLSDLDVLIWTFTALFPEVARRPVPENSLYSGPVWNFIRRYFNWFATDTLVALVATGVIGILTRLSGPLDIGWGKSLLMAVMIGLLFGLINTLLGLQRISWDSASPVHVFDLAFSSGLTTGIVFLVGELWRTGPFLPKGMIIEIGLVAFLGFVAVRYRQRLLTGLAGRWMLLRGEAATMGERVLIIGAGDCGQLAAWLLKKSNLASAFYVTGMVDDDPYKYKMVFDGHRVLGSTHDIPEVVQKKNIGVVLYAISKIDEAERERILNICSKLPVRVVVVPDLIQLLQNQFLNSNMGAS